MSLAERLLDWIYDLDEQSFKRKATKNEIDNLASQITRHMFFVTHFQSNQAFKHWMGELNTWANRISDKNLGKSNKQNLDAKDIKKIIFPYYETEGDQKLKINSAVKKGMIKSVDDIEFDFKRFDKAIDKFIQAIVRDEEFTL